MSDLRSNERALAFVPGQVLAAERRDEWCTIKDISETGAKLSFRNVTLVPESEFVLQIPSRSQSFRAAIVWRRGREVGVRLTPYDLRKVGA